MAGGPRRPRWTQAAAVCGKRGAPPGPLRLLDCWPAALAAAPRAAVVRRSACCPGAGSGRTTHRARGRRMTMRERGARCSRFVPGSSSPSSGPPATARWPAGPPSFRPCSRGSTDPPPPPARKPRAKAPGARRGLASSSFPKCGADSAALEWPHPRQWITVERRFSCWTSANSGKNRQSHTIAARSRICTACTIGCMPRFSWSSHLVTSGRAGGPQERRGGACRWQCKHCTTSNTGGRARSLLAFRARARVRGAHGPRLGLRWRSARAPGQRGSAQPTTRPVRSNMCNWRKPARGRARATTHPCLTLRTAAVPLWFAAQGRGAADSSPAQVLVEQRNSTRGAVPRPSRPSRRTQSRRSAGQRAASTSSTQSALATPAA